MGILKEFKAFAMKGNLADVAIAFVLGAAFNKFITSFTAGIVSPLIGLIVGRDFSAMKIMLRESTEVKDAAGKVMSGLPELSLQYGTFLGAVLDFIIIAFVCFIFIKAILKKDPNAAPETPATEVLLAEIRDALKK